MMKIGQQSVVTIEKIVYGGEGIGKLEEGLVIFVPFSAPKEKLRVVIREIKKNYVKGTIKEILEKGKGRVLPPCPSYGSCGGCAYQHLDYETELEIKQAQLEEIFSCFKKNHSFLIQNIVHGPFPYGYRNRISLHVRNGKVGFYEKASNRIVPIKSCLIASEKINVLLKKWLNQKRKYVGPKTMHVSLREPDIPSYGFYQVNRYLLEKMRELVDETIGREISQIIEGYSGAGFFTEYLKLRMEKIYAIEENHLSVKYAKALGLKNVFFIEGKVEDKLADCLSQIETAKAAYLFDPPKEGISKEVISLVNSHPLPKLIYVSCNPLTLKRDIQRLEKNYLLRTIKPVDLFPKTPEIECIALLTTKNGSQR